MALVLGTNCGFVTETPSGDPAETAASLGGRTNVGRYTSPSNIVKVIEIGFWADAVGGTANGEVGIYTDNTDPDTLVGKQSFSITAGEAGTWKAVTVDIDILPNTTYWLAVQIDTGDSHTSNYNYNYGDRWGYATDESTLANPCTELYASDDYRFAIYAVYEEAAGEINSNLTLIAGAGK